MSTDFKKISNPLTIIAIFAGLAEINATVVIGLLPADLQEIFIWFIILFPTILVVVFFYTLNFNPKVLYAPSDFTNEENFLKTMDSSIKSFTPVKMDITKENYKDVKSFTDIVKKVENKNYNDEPFLTETKKHLQLANSFWDEFRVLINQNFEDGIIKELSYGIQAPEYFIINYSVSEDILKQKGRDFTESIIIRVTEDDNEKINLIAIGKNIIEKDPKIFSNKLLEYVNKRITNIIDKNS